MRVITSRCSARSSYSLSSGRGEGGYREWLEARPLPPRTASLEEGEGWKARGGRGRGSLQRDEIKFGSQCFSGVEKKTSPDGNKSGLVGRFHVTAAPRK